ncbi:MAG: tetratricopeptide repeat protein [Planctomycetota bacterium]|jgi:tetratricopeptide (TPR) repeat protein
MLLRAVKAHFAAGALLSVCLAVATGCRPPERPEDTGPAEAQAAARPSGGGEEYPLSGEERAAACYQAGLEYELAGDPGSAEECYRRAAELDPAEIGYRVRLGLLLAAVGRRGEGVDFLEAARDLGNRSFAVLQTLAEHYSDSGQEERAAEHFEMMLKGPELSVPGRVRDGAVLRMSFYLIGFYSRARRPGDAARVAEFMIGRFPGRPEFRLERAKHLLRAGAEALALEEIAAFEKRLPGSSAGARMLALHYSDRKLYAQALERAEAALVRLKAEPGATAGEVSRMRYFRADLLGKVRRFDEAAEELRGLLAGARDDGEKVEALVAMTYLDRARGKSGEAAGRLRGALASGMRSGRLYAALGAALADTGDLTEACRAYRRAQQISPDDVLYRLSLARLLERMGRRAQAAAELRAALMISPEDPECSSFLAVLYAEEGIRLEEAAERAATALRADPDSPRYLDAQGRVFFRQGLIDEARKALERAALKGAGAAGLERLGDAYFALGLWRRARVAWEKALGMGAPRPAVEKKLERITEARGRPTGTEDQ